MKKVLLSAMAMLFAGALMAQTIVSTEVEKRNVIIEEYTGVGCGYCPDGHARANAICAQYSNHAWAINIHEGGYADGSGYETALGDGLASQYNISGYPCGTVNRGAMSSRGDWASQAATVRGQDSPVNVAATATIDPLTRELVVNVEMYVTGTQSATSNRLNVALVQNNIIGPQSNYGDYNPDYILPDGNYRHMHMFRHLLTGQWGEEITGLSVGTLIERSYTYSLPMAIGAVPIANFSDLEIIVFVAENQKNIITGAKADLTILPAVYMAGLTYEENGCGIDYTPVVTIANTTTEDASSFTFTSDNNQVFSSKTIAPGQTDTFHMPTYSIQYDNTPVQHYAPSIEVTFDSYDNQTDGTVSVGVSGSVDVAPVNMYTVAGPLKMRVAIDGYGKECQVKLFNQANGCSNEWTWAESSWTNIGPDNAQYISQLYDARPYWMSFNPATPGIYVLRIIDTYGDGWRWTNNDNPSGVWLDDANGSVIAESWGYSNGPSFSTIDYYLNVTTSGDGSHVGIDNAEPVVEFTVYPNPVNEYLTINCSDAIRQVEILDVAGRTVMTANGNQTVINTEALSAGVYMLRVVTENGVSAQKFVKE